MANGRVIPVTMVKALLGRQNHMDKSHRPLVNEHDASGPRAGSYRDPKLNRSGSRSTRSHHHVTGIYSVNLKPEVNPPLYIYSSRAKNPQVKYLWVETLGNGRGKWGHNNFVSITPQVATRPEGSMDSKLFMTYIEYVIAF